MPFPKKKNPKLQEASKKGHLARWGGKRIKVEAEAKLPLPLLELPEPNPVRSWPGSWTSEPD